MKRLYNKDIKNLFFFTCEHLLIFFANIFASYLRFGFDISNKINFELIIYKTLIVTIICQICLYYNDLYSHNFNLNLSKRELFLKIIQSLLESAGILFIIYYIFPDIAFGRGIFFLTLMTLSPLLLFWRRVYRYLLDKDIFKERILIIGSVGLAKKIGVEIFNRKDLGFELIGFIDNDPKKIGQKIVNPSVIGTYDDIMNAVENNKIDRIIVAMSERRGISPINSLLKCKLSGVIIDDGATFYEKMLKKIPVEGLKPSWLIFSEGFKYIRLSKNVKRFTDLVLSVIGLIISSPFFLFVPIIIKMESSGPIFFRQVRVGYNGETFSLIKFRSMLHGAEKNMGPVWALKNDSRITKVGNFIRKTRIDELPQLVNVLVGDMSFVGPRPERPHFVNKLRKKIPYYNMRLAVKPGITGWAQVKYEYGASVEDALEKLQYDLYYIKNMSLIFDCSIIFETLKVVFSGRGR